MARQRSRTRNCTLALRRVRAAANAANAAAAAAVARSIDNVDAALAALPAASPTLLGLNPDVLNVVFTHLRDPRWCSIEHLVDVKHTCKALYRAIPIRKFDKSVDQSTALSCRKHGILGQDPKWFHRDSFRSAWIRCRDAYIWIITVVTTATTSTF